MCIEGSESKVIVVPWVSSCMGFVPEGSSMSSRGRSPRVQIPYSIVQVTCAIALLWTPLIVSQEAIALYTVPFKYQQLWCKCLL